ncbi:hypothetical protein C8A05DRAFT_19409 [Staphylotrichum tortipilum]|uniref:Uncharacterized protein n=1 Tax=Staphylotrichum tortipilum TaxID=2831512 RepID=A0AAN6RNS8_9PEZI|nr:hypothetical protein C8A05DRAFT_19409 [Staphylotrichum longicolle]
MSLQPPREPSQSSDGREISLPEPVDPTRSQGIPSRTTSAIPKKGISAKTATLKKRRRLRELQDAHPSVETIVSHMEKYYRTFQPPAWLNLRAVAEQLMRSCQQGSKHTAWRSVRDRTIAVAKWKGNHSTWTEAVKQSKMPYIGTRSEIKATEFIEGGASVPRCIWLGLRNVGLHFLLEHQVPGREILPNFWKDAEVDDPEWVSSRLDGGSPCG